jgi:hypothetical protein
LEYLLNQTQEGETVDPRDGGIVSTYDNEKTQKKIQQEL